MMNHHDASGSEETMQNLPPVVPSRAARRLIRPASAAPLGAIRSLAYFTSVIGRRCCNYRSALFSTSTTNSNVPPRHDRRCLHPPNEFPPIHRSRQRGRYRGVGATHPSPGLQPPTTRGRPRHATRRSAKVDDVLSEITNPLAAPYKWRARIGGSGKSSGRCVNRSP